MLTYIYIYTEKKSKFNVRFLLSTLVSRSAYYTLIILESGWCRYFDLSFLLIYTFIGNFSLNKNAPICSCRILKYENFSPSGALFEHFFFRHSTVFSSKLKHFQEIIFEFLTREYNMNNTIILTVARFPLKMVFWLQRFIV